MVGSDGKIIFQKEVGLQPLQNLQETIHLNNDQRISDVTLGNCELNLKDSTAKVLSRPTKPLVKIDYDSAYGHYLKGYYQAGMRNYIDAEANITKSLQLDPSFIPSLSEMAMLQYRKMNYQGAFEYARKAISLNTYDGAANYYYGLAALKLGKVYDAEDGFEVATLTGEYRSAAYTELSKIKLQQKKLEEAFTYASKSLVYNSENITALQLQYLAARLQGNKQLEKTVGSKILSLNPFNHFVRFEAYWANPSEEMKSAFINPIRDELSQQTYLNLAVWYHNLGLDKECASVLEASPKKDNEILYWLAWLHRNSADVKQLLDEAQRGIAYLVFPFRPESAQVMEWALKNTNDWKPGYYLALIYESAHDRIRARKTMEHINTQNDFAPFYVFRARVCDSADKQSQLNYLTKASKIAPGDWLYVKYLTEFLIAQKQDQQALKTVEPFYKMHPDNYIIGMLYARSLMLNDKYDVAEKVIDQLQVLPYEGAKDGHKLYEQTKLELALQLIVKDRLQDALKKVKEARLWPEHLGVGAPYPEDVDSSLENSMDELIKRSNHEKPSAKTLDDYRTRVKAINGI